MARINLLPWREERRKLRQNEFYAILAAAAIAGLLVFGGIWYQYKLQIDGQNARNQYLTEQIGLLDEKIKKIEELDRRRATLIARKNVIEQLQANRWQLVRIFDDLVRTMPEGVRLTSVKASGEQLTLEGVAESNARVSSYMKNLEVANLIKDPDLAIVEAKGPDRRSRYVFTLRVTIKKPQTDEEAEAGQAPVAETAANAPRGSA
ncbi:MAG TPA: PilN domain-containing protein [Xanthomonadales bacterium]|nr:PilN domain-containing protein [Xanthomonadales bacterium]